MPSGAFWNFIYGIWAIDTLVSIVSLLIIIRGGVLWFRGILPVALRVGNGLARRQIMVFASADNFASLRNLLVDSKLFREKNIKQVVDAKEVRRAEEETMFLVNWDDWKNNIQNILDSKPDKCALIVYAPPSAIPPGWMSKLDSRRYTIVANLRGRLINDIIVSMISTSYKRS